jgi:16S rRNA (cytidine1402-2'-O)-methyltransferase
MNKQGILYLVSTPIGNLKDMSLRALDILNEVDIIFCEDTRVSKKLLSHYKINKKLISANDNNEDSIKEELLSFLQNNKNVALISDAGTPLISDPGFKIVKYIIEKGFKVVPIPGATAFIPALIISGINPYPFLFFGFLNNKSEKRKKQLEKLKRANYTIIFYEAPHRLVKTLNDIKEIMGDRIVCISREITKLHEEVFRGKVSDYLKNQEKIIKGEYVIIVEGNNDQEINDEEICKEIEFYIKEGYSQKEAIKEVANHHNVSKNKVYNLYHKR